MSILMIAGRIILALCMLGASLRLISQTSWQQEFQRDQNALHMVIEQHIASDEVRLSSLETTAKRVEDYHIPERLALIEAYQKTITELLWTIVAGIILILFKDLVLWLRRGADPPKRTRWGHAYGRRKGDQGEEP
jgi:hypothetical protein